jgi:hypothetical protein
MTPDWSTLIAPRPLAVRAVRLPLPGLSAPVCFASAHAMDLKELPPEAFLAAVEIARASAFKFGQPRENFTLGRLAGKLALAAAGGANRPLTPALSPSEGEGEKLSQRLRSFEIGNGERGEPVVRAGGCKPLTLAVSLSHVNGLGAAVAFPADVQVGLDLELIDARRAETVRKGVPLSAEEECWLKATDLPEATALLLLWTARESLGKALGTGLACKWETLALRAIEAAGDGNFSGQFLHQPQFRCVSWVGPEAVLSLAFAPA